METTERVAETAIIPAGEQAPKLLYALNPEELGVARGTMTEYFRARLDEQRTAEQEQRAAVELATRNRWGVQALKNALAATEKRVVFYAKVVAALEAGYLVIPNLPMANFAIRTDRKMPARVTLEGDSWHAPSPQRHEQEPRLLPLGEGENFAPVPATDKWTENRMQTVNHQTGEQRQKAVWFSAADEWRGVEFPIALARPEVMDATARALALKLFDEVGVVNDMTNQNVRSGARRRADPIVVGRLRNPRLNRPHMSFFIAWAADLSRV